MATATILNIGNDVCYRIPLMEHAGLLAVRTECSVRALQNAFAGGESFSGIAFHNEIEPRSRAVVTAARELSTAPLILFRDSLVDCDESLFDLVIPVQTSPAVWLKCLRETLQTSRDLWAASEQLRQDSANARAVSRKLRRIVVQNRETPIDCDSFWRNTREE